MGLWPWLVASAAIHGLVFMSWTLYEPAHSAIQASHGVSRVTVELLGEEAEVPGLDEARIQQPDTKTKLLQRHKSVAELLFSRAKDTPVVDSDADTNIHAAAAKSVANAAATMNRQFSSEHLSSVVRQHLEGFKYYPASARRRGIEGAVEVRFSLASGGRAAGLEVITGSGYAVLDRAALQTVHRAEPFPLDSGFYRFRLVFHRS